RLLRDIFGVGGAGHQRGREAPHPLDVGEQFFRGEALRFRHAGTLGPGSRSRGCAGSIRTNENDESPRQQHGVQRGTAKERAGTVSVLALRGVASPGDTGRPSETEAQRVGVWSVGVSPASRSRMSWMQPNTRSPPGFAGLHAESSSGSLVLIAPSSSTGPRTYSAIVIGPAPRIPRPSVPVQPVDRVSDYARNRASTGTEATTAALFIGPRAAPRLPRNARSLSRTVPSRIPSCTSIGRRVSAATWERRARVKTRRRAASAWSTSSPAWISRSTWTAWASMRA